jgi:amino acid permease
MKRNFLFSIFSICFTFFIFGCATLQQTPPRISMQSLDKNAIITGTGGGFSGQYNGFVITRSGDVLSWQSPNGMPDSLELLFHTTPDSVNFFFRYLDEIGFNELSFRSSGNMNSFIERMTADSKHHVQWATDGGVSAPPEISTFYSFVRSYALRIPHKR